MSVREHTHTHTHIQRLKHHIQGFEVAMDGTSGLMLLRVGHLHFQQLSHNLILVGGNLYLY